MDKTVKYRQIVCQVVDRMVPPPQSSGLEVFAVKDKEGDHCSITHAGWVNGKYFFGCVLQIDLKEGPKVWVRHNGTEAEIGDDLVKAGIEKQDIVLAFLPEETRTLDGFAVR